MNNSTLMTRVQRIYAEGYFREDGTENNFKARRYNSKIIEVFFQVYNKLGFGFLENVYERAMLIELVKNGLRCVRQFPITVLYEGVNVGKYFADILVNDFVIIEIKAAANLCEDHEKQLINYLKATEIEVRLLLNFGVKPQFKRKIFSGAPERRSKQLHADDTTDEADRRGF